MHRFTNRPADAPSEAPGPYVVYDSTNASKLDKQTLARTVTVHEGGRVVSSITVDSLEEMSKSRPQPLRADRSHAAAGAIC